MLSIAALEILMHKKLPLGSENEQTFALFLFFGFFLFCFVLF
jgi:hypothetical protein